jgi:hypothetical protein
VAFDACICWMIDSKVFCNCSSFSQSSTILVFQGSFSYGNTNPGLWLLVVTTKTMLIMGLFFFFDSTWETLF